MDSPVICPGCILPLALTTRTGWSTTASLKWISRRMGGKTDWWIARLVVNGWKADGWTDIFYSFPSLLSLVIFLSFLFSFILVYFLPFLNFITPVSSFRSFFHSFLLLLFISFLFYCFFLYSFVQLSLFLSSLLSFSSFLLFQHPCLHPFLPFFSVYPSALVFLLHPH